MRFLLVALAVLSACSPRAATPTTPSTARVQIGGKVFNLELARTEEDRNRGLMYRGKLAADGGMLFVFPDSGYRQFWMKNCLIGLDIIFLAPDGRVVSVHTLPAPPADAMNSQVPRCASAEPAQFAIELSAGTAGGLGLKENDRVGLPEWVKVAAR